jgi:competence protein ComFC
MTGYNAYGHPEFDTKYSELGELVYRLKNRNDKECAHSIAETAVKFIADIWKPKFDFIALVPPSRKRDGYQPVLEIANRIGEHLPAKVKSGAITKIKDTPQLKDVSDYQERIALLDAAFAIDEEAVSGKRISLIDDLYRSGATAAVVTEALVLAGASRVYVLAMTKTRRTR